jgi:hypothetical protein
MPNLPWCQCLSSSHWNTSYRSGKYDRYCTSFGRIARGLARFRAEHFFQLFCLFCSDLLVTANLGFMRVKLSDSLIGCL